MRKTLLLVFLAAILCASPQQRSRPGAPPARPKLVLAIVVDQFRYDYLTRFRSEYRAGFDRLLTKGAVYTNANYLHFPTVTAVGHSTFLTGAFPSVSGIVGNDWFDRDEKIHVTSILDNTTRLLGGTGTGASPRRMLVSTVGDELKMANGGKSKVIGISLKDRAAILPAGHAANGAYWFDLGSGNFVSSTYYFADLPGWVKDFNAARPGEKYRGVVWLNHTLPTDLKELYGDSTHSPLEASPFGNELVEQLAERALSAEQLGMRDVTDMLTVSFSSNDKVGHDYGTFSPEEHEVTVQTDKILERLFVAIDKQVGLANAIVVLTADHGVAPSAAEDAANRMPGGRMAAETIRNAVQAALVRKHGAGEWVQGSWDLSIYLNLDLIAQKGLDAADVRKTAAGAAMRVAHVHRIYTRDQLLIGAVPGDSMSQRVMNGFNVRRSPDLAIILEPYWLLTNSVSTHGSTYSYDSHVPVIFMGGGVKAGRYHSAVAVNDIAPTLATMLDVEIPSGSAGRVLTEMLP